MFLIFLSLHVSALFTVPRFISEKELQEFYERTEKHNVSVRHYEGKGLGLMLKKQVNVSDDVVCITTHLAMTHSDPSFSSYTKTLNPIESLAFRILFERFLGKPGEISHIYANTLPDTIPSSINWTQKNWDLLKKFSLFSNIELRLDLSTSYMKIKKVLTKVHKVDERMLKNETIDWALRTVLSRYLTYVDEKFGEVHFLGPYLDLVNHWPRADVGNFSAVSKKDGKICLKSPFRRSAGEEFVIDYGSHESFNFFHRYMISVQNNPNDLIVVRYKGKRQEYNTYLLESSRINLQLLEAFTFESGTYVKISKDFKTFYKKNIKSKKAFSILRALYNYRAYFQKFSSYSKYPGLRESRRYIPNSSTESQILNFAISSRQSLYLHLQSIDRELLHLFYHSFLSSS